MEAILAIAVGVVLLVLPALLVALGGGAAGIMLGRLTGGLLANFSTAMRLYGGPAGPQASPLNVLEWASAGEVAEALADLDDETIALVLARLRPKFARKVLRHLPAHRHEWVGYWLERPQPCTRREQAALARRLKRDLGITST